MTPKQQKRINAYARTLADELGLKDWRVRVEREPPSSETSDADCRLPYGHKTVIIRVCEAHFDFDPDQQREDLTHELLHAHFDGVERSLKELDGQVHRDVFTMVDRRFELGLELAVSGLARVIAPRLPYPPYAKKKEPR